MKYQYIFGRLGKKISRIRKEKDLYQDDLAEVEEGKANPSLKVLCKIASRLNIQLYQLFMNI